MLSDYQHDSLMKLPALKGSALSIFIALLIAGIPLTRNQLIVYTGFERDTVTKGIQKLEVLRVIWYLGKGRGWQLSPNWQQLPLPVLFFDKAKKSPYKGEKIALSEALPHTRDTTLLTTTTYSDQDQVVVVTREDKAKKSPYPVDNSIQDWLIRGGISRNSPAMKRLLEMELALDFVKAHVLERLARVREGGTNFHPGLLIVRLRDGDTAPPLRCEGCLEIESDCLCHIPKCPDCGIRGRCNCQIIRR